MKENDMNIDPHLKQILGLNTVSQIGIVVRDMETAIRNYSDIFGIIFTKVFIPEYFNKIYRGKPGDFRFKVALGMMGELQIELIEVLEGQTIYGEFLEKKGEGLHHLGFDVENMDERIEALERLGISVLQSGERVGVRWAYMDTEQLVGVIFELLQREKNI
jgi:methylmalonyl-CoA/ethylmalonyl-CoA epimerase